MAVTIVVKASGQLFRGKFAEVQGAKVALYSGIVPDGKSGFRGCGKKSVFQTGEVEVLAHQRDIEVREREAGSGTNGHERQAGPLKP